MRSRTLSLAIAILIAFLIAGGSALFVYSQGVPQAGYMVLAAASGNPSPVGIALFSNSNAAGVLVSQAGVASAEPIRTGRIIVDQTGTLTGLGLVNPSETVASAILILRDANGVEVSRQPLLLTAGQHLSRYV